MCDAPPVHIHSVLESRGGATAIARALHESLLREEADSTFGFEMAELGDASRAALCAPQDVGAQATPSRLVHLHATRDWTACLDGVAGHPASLVTLHDFSLLTGGCHAPLECQQWRTGCGGPCPQAYPETGAECRRRRDAVGRVAPVLVSPSRYLAASAREVFPQADVRVIPNGVPWPRGHISRAEARRIAEVPQDAKLVLFVAHGGTKAAFKAGGKWHDVWRSIKAAVPEAQCFMVGGERFERQGDVTHWPYVDRRTMMCFMRAADVLAYPTMADNHPLVVLEAMSMELPCVAFGVGGIPEQMVHGESGMVPAPGRWNDLAAQVAMLLKRPRLARGIGRGGYEHGQTRFTRERMVADYLRLYRRLGERLRTPV